MKKLFLVFSLLISFVSFAQINGDSIDSIYCDVSCMKFYQESGKNTSICGLAFIATGGIIMSCTNITYAKILNDPFIDQYNKDAALNKHKAYMTVSIGFMVGGILINIMGINQMSKRIKYENGSLVYKF